MTEANHLAEDAMKGRQAAVLAVLCLILALVSFGCSARDYPPKTKKAWLSDNFVSMEEIHSDHTEDPTDDGGLPLPAATAQDLSARGTHWPYPPAGQRGIRP